MPAFYRGRLAIIADVACATTANPLRSTRPHGLTPSSPDFVGLLAFLLRHVRRRCNAYSSSFAGLQRCASRVLKDLISRFVSRPLYLPLGKVRVLVLSIHVADHQILSFEATTAKPELLNVSSSQEPWFQRAPHCRFRKAKYRQCSSSAAKEWIGTPHASLSMFSKGR